MAQGAINPESGTWVYGSDDPGLPAWQLLNKLATTVRDQFIQLRQRVHTLESDQPAIRPGMTPLNSYTLNPATAVVQLQDLVLLTLVAYRAQAAGGIAALEVAQLPAGTWPSSTLTVQGVASQGGSATVCTVTISPSGRIRCWTTSSANGRLDLSLFWLAA